MTAPAEPLDLLVSVVAWVNDDREVLPAFLDEVEAVLHRHYRFYEVVFVDNHGDDGSLDLILEAMRTRPNLRLLRLSRPASHEVGYAAGLEHAIGDYVLVMDLYLDRPEDIPRMVDAARGGFDVVIGRREPAPHDGPLRRAVFALVSRMLGERLEPDQSYFRLFSRRVVTSITRIKHRRRFLRYLNAVVGYRQRVLPTRLCDRAALVRERYGLLTSARNTLDLVFSHSATPLRWASVLALLASFLNLAYLVYILVVVLVKSKLAEGWLTTSVMIGSMFFLLFLVLAVLAEYVARILEEAQERPLYFVELEAESTVSTRREEQGLNVV